MEREWSLIAERIQHPDARRPGRNQPPDLGGHRGVLLALIEIKARLLSACKSSQYSMPSMRIQRGSQGWPDLVFTSSGNPSSRRIEASLRMIISAGRNSSPAMRRASPAVSPSPTSASARPACRQIDRRRHQEDHPIRTRPAAKILKENPRPPARRHLLVSHHTWTIPAGDRPLQCSAQPGFIQHHPLPTQSAPDDLRPAIVDPCAQETSRVRGIPRPRRRIPPAGVRLLR